MFSFNINEHKYLHVHFIGIGGISMSGLAEILLFNGYKVSGSDIKDSPILDRLRRKGALIYIGHKSENIEGADLIVFTSAISNDNPEYIHAINTGIPTIDRAAFLGQIMRGYENSIAVAGSHGKTTTTGMLALILNNSTLSPTILLGGELDQIGGNVKIGNGSYFLTEACEYKRNFLKFFPKVGIILNIEEDHLDYFKDINDIIDTFSDFAALIPNDGYLIINNDDEKSQQIIEKAKCNIITFGINNKSHFQGKDITFTEDGFPGFNLIINNGKNYEITLKVPGKHNVYNALAAIAAAYVCNIPIENILNSIQSFTGTHRRFERKGIINGIRIIDDYAHHPTEIKATLKAAKKITPNRVWCVFQPHTYTRTKALLDDFANSFFDADKVIVTDIYAAREKDTGLIHSTDLVKLLQDKELDAVYINNFEQIADFIMQNAEKDDIVITMGAGNIYNVADILLSKTKIKSVC